MRITFKNQTEKIKEIDLNFQKQLDLGKDSALIHILKTIEDNMLHEVVKRRRETD